MTHPVLFYDKTASTEELPYSIGLFLLKVLEGIYSCNITWTLIRTQVAGRTCHLTLQEREVVDQLLPDCHSILIGSIASIYHLAVCCQTTELTRHATIDVAGFEGIVLVQ